MIRYTAVSVAETALAFGIVLPALVGTLIACSGGANRLIASALSAAVEAIDIAPIAALTHDDLAMTSRTVVQTPAWATHRLSFADKH